MSCTLLLALATLPELLGTSFPWELRAAPAKNRVAWIESKSGPWNLWVADGPTGAPRQLTRFTADDGQELRELAWSADANHLVFVRGGQPNRTGDIPNPTSDPKGAERAIWTIPFAGGEPRKLAEGDAPVVSPATDRVVWARGGTVWSVALSGEGKPAILFKVRGGASDLAFSPDGAKLAFSSPRTDHAFIGVFDINAKTLTWLDPSTDRDSLPTWSPDGTSVAFLRRPSERAPIPFGARREAMPWSIRVARLDTGAARELFHASEGRGSVFQPVFIGPSLIWTSAGHIVFPWERTGWKLLYAVPVQGGAARLLTPGEFEVESVATTPGGAALIVSSNQGDIDRRHLWRVPVASGAPQRITSGTGIEWAPNPLSDGETIALLRSDARTPAHPAVLTKAGELRPLAPPTLDTRSFVEPQPVHFPAADGLMIPGQIFLPPGAKPGERRPAVIFFHGGSRRQMLLGWHPMYYYHNAYAFNQFLASRGYVVLSVNYRSGIGYGMEFREALDYGATGASEYQDVVGAGLYLRARAEVDPARIGLWGGSYGGYLTALGLARASHLFAAGVDLHGVHEWVRDIQDTRPGSAAFKEEFQRRAWESSPMSSVDSWRSPVLLIHGDDDRNVNFNQTVQLVEALRKRNVEFEQLIFPDEVHDFLMQKNWLRALEAAASFLDRKLKPKP